MNIWVVKIGEPIPLDCNCQERLHRTGILSNMLAKKGHNVTWWTSTFDRVSRRNVFEKDTIISPKQGLRVILLHSQGYRKSISFARLLDHRRVASKFAKFARQECKPDVILCAYPTIELSKACVDFGNEHNVPVVLDMRDMWPDILIDSLPKHFRLIARILLHPMFKDAKSACSRATAIVGITDEFVNWGLNKAGLDKRANDLSFSMAYSLTPPQNSQLQDAELFWDNLGIRSQPDYFTICFLGTLGHQFDITTVIEAARKLSKNETFSCRFVICGNGDKLSDFRKSAQRDDNIIFPGWVNEAQMYALMMRSNVGLNPIQDRYDFLSTINNKAIEYLSAGLPIVMSPPRGVLYDLIRAHDCGMGYEPNDVSGLVTAIEYLVMNPAVIKKMSENAIGFYNDKFSTDKVYGDMVRYLERVAGAV